jgi:DNA-binding CsgD family transcriptional regulator
MATPTAPTQQQACCCASAHLTEREITVLCALASGATSQETAAALRLSRRTVDAHVASMLSKAGVRNRGELLTVTVAHGILDMTSGTPGWSGRSCLPARDLATPALPGRRTPTEALVALAT